MTEYGKRLISAARIRLAACIAYEAYREQDGTGSKDNVFFEE